MFPVLVKHQNVSKYAMAFRLPPFVSKYLKLSIFRPSTKSRQILSRSSQKYYLF